MFKVIITTVLDPEIKNKLATHSKKTYIPYSKLIEYSINGFKSKNKNLQNYLIKYSDFDRIKTQSFTSSVPENINNELLKLSETLEISKRMLLRELITDFVNDNC